MSKSPSTSYLGINIPMPPVKPPPRAIFRSAFALGDRVHIDDDRDLIARVTGFLWGHEEGAQLRLSWMSNGDAKEAWFPVWRVTAVE
jgi:hypothetical protein